MLHADIQTKVSQIADLQRELERLRDVEQRFEDFANSARDFAFITLDLNNAVVGWNKGAEQVLGYSEAEVVGKAGTLFFTPEDVATGEPECEIATARAEGRAEDERWHLRKDGTRFWGSGVMTLLRDHAGQVRGYAKVMRDFTEQRKRIEALRISEERFRLLVENVRDCALFPVDLEGNITDWNPGAERIFGYTAAEVVGLSFIDLFAADEDARNFLRADLEKTAREDGASADCWLMRKDRSRFYASWVTNSVRDETGRLIGYTKVLRDETERKRNEEEREQQLQRDREVLEGQVRFTNSALDRTKEDLEELAGQLLHAQDTERRAIARDLHDHLAQTLVFLDLKLSQLRNGPTPSADELQSELGKIQQQISNLSDEVRDLSHRLHPATLEHVGLVAALKRLVEEYHPHRINSIQIDTADFFEDGLQPETRAALYRIVQEGLRNVQRHAGDVPVTVTLYRSPEGIYLEIQDEGPGFSHDSIRGRRTLGLISMAERARLLGGTLSVTSAPGRGAKLEVALPLARPVYQAHANSSGG